MAKQWKSNGPEQEVLEKMFEEGAIEEWETPSLVQGRNAMFKPFSERVFSNHFRSTKLKMGCGSNDTVRQINEENKIPELGQVSPNVQCRSTASTSFEFKSDSGINFKNAPYLSWTYSDHVRNCDFVCVAVCMISGCRDINFSLSEDGTKVHIAYVWPSALYSPQELFHGKLKANELAIDHPKIHAFASRLLECGLTPKSLPQTLITIDLPTKVLRENGTYTKSGVKFGDSRIALLEFQAFQKKIVIEDADTSITFE